MPRPSRLPRRRPRRHVLVGAAAIVVLALAAGGLGVLLMQRDRADRAAAEEAARSYRGPAVTAPASRIVSVVADELTAAPDGTSQAATWPMLMGASVGARVFVNVPGGSYSRSAVTDGPTLVNAAGAVAPRADVVVVFGGRDDAGVPRKTLLDSAARVYAAATAAAPNAQLVVVGPVAAPKEADAAVLAVRDALRTATHRTHATFVDPIAAGWFATPADAFSSDGELTATGQRRMAAYVQRSVSAALR